MILQDYAFKGLLLFRWEPVIVSHYPDRLVAIGICGSGDKIFFGVEEQDSICCRLNLSLLFISCLKQMA